MGISCTCLCGVTLIAHLRSPRHPGSFAGTPSLSEYLEVKFVRKQLCGFHWPINKKFIYSSMVNSYYQLRLVTAKDAGWRSLFNTSFFPSSDSVSEGTSSQRLSESNERHSKSDTHVGQNLSDSQDREHLSDSQDRENLSEPRDMGSLDLQDRQELSESEKSQNLSDSQEFQSLTESQEDKLPWEEYFSRNLAFSRSCLWICNLVYT